MAWYFKSKTALPRPPRDAHVPREPGLGQPARLVELEAGHLGRARLLLHDAVRLLERGRHARELQGLAAARLLVDLYGRGAAAARGADLGRSLRQARAAHRAGVARALAELALAEGRTRAATRLLELGSSAAGDTAERFRCAARAATLQGGGTQGLLALAERLGEGRLLETRWRTEPITAPEELLALMPQLQARGRTDLAAAIARSLVRIASASGDADSRRRASSRLEDARRQLVESLDDGLAEHAAYPPRLERRKDGPGLDAHVLVAAGDSRVGQALRNTALHCKVVQFQIEEGAAVGNLWRERTDEVVQMLLLHQRRRKAARAAGETERHRRP